MARLSRSRPKPDKRTERVLRQLGVPLWCYTGTDEHGNLTTDKGRVTDPWSPEPRLERSSAGK